jgi:hypothetical protein
MVGDKALNEVFPNLYCIACAKDASVAAHLSFLVTPISGMYALLE